MKDAVKQFRTSPNAEVFWVIEKGNLELVEPGGPQFSIRRWEQVGAVCSPKDVCALTDTLESARTYANPGAKRTGVTWPEMPFVVEVLI